MGEYPNVSDDPEPIKPNFTDEEKDKHLKKIYKYTNSILKSYQDMKLDRESLWLGFIMAFRPETIKLCDSNTLSI